MSSEPRPRAGRSAKRRRREHDRPNTRPAAPRPAGPRPAGRRAAEAPTASRPSVAVVSTILALVGGIALVAVIALSQGVAPGSAGPGSAASGAPTNAAGLVPPSAPVPGDLGDTPRQLGNPNAPLTVEVTEDFQCPICGMFAREYLPRLVVDFVRPGTVRLVVHDVEFLDRGSSTESLEAATAAGCAADQGRYWEYHDWLYANQQGENQGAFGRSRLDAIADAVELDRTAFDSCMSATTERSKVQADTNAAIAANITKTPTFVINGGQPIAGLPAYEDLAGYIRSLIPSGTPSGAPAASPSAS